MATVNDIYQFLNQIAPFSTQEDFDNAGFLVGRKQAEVSRVLLALDITKEVAQEAAQQNCQLVLAHHPVIFHSLRTLTDQSPVGEILLELAQNSIAVICAHTNLDAAMGGVNCALAQALHLREVQLLVQGGMDENNQPYGIGRVGLAPDAGKTAGEFAAFVKTALNAPDVRFVDGGKPVRCVAVGGGACASMLQEAVNAGCDTFVTADIKHDQFLQARALALTLLDAGHFVTERVILPPLRNRLQGAFPTLTIMCSSQERDAYTCV